MCTSCLPHILPKEGVVDTVEIGKKTWCTKASADAAVLVPREAIWHGRRAWARARGERGPGDREVELDDL